MTVEMTWVYDVDSYSNLSGDRPSRSDQLRSDPCCMSIMDPQSTSSKTSTSMPSHSPSPLTPTTASHQQPLSLSDGAPHSNLFLHPLRMQEWANHSLFVARSLTHQHGLQSACRRIEVSLACSFIRPNSTSRFAQHSGSA